MTKIIEFGNMKVIKWNIEAVGQKLVEIIITDCKKNLSVSECKVLVNILQNQLNEYNEKKEADFLITGG